MPMKFLSALSDSAGVLLTFSVIALVSFPKDTTWRWIAGISCAVSGTIYLLVMFIVKKTNKATEFQVSRKQIGDFDNGGDFDHGSNDHHE